MSTVGFQSPTPAPGAALTVGEPYTFRIGVIQDDANGFTVNVEPVITGSATRDPDATQAVGDTGSGEASSRDWTITPTAAGTLTVEVDKDSLDFDVEPGAGSRTYTVTEPPAASSGMQRLSLGLGLGL